MLDSDESRGTTSGLAPHLFRAAVLVTFALLATQLWRLQIVEGPQLRQRADNNRVRVSQITPPRGVIYDRKGTLAASNAPIFVVSIVPADLKAAQEPDTYARLSGLVGVPVPEMRQAVEKRKADGYPFDPVPIKSNVPREAALLVEQDLANLPGVKVTVESARKYTEGRLLAHILGYLGPISPSVLSAAEYKQKIERGRLHHQRQDRHGWPRGHVRVRDAGSARPTAVRGRGVRPGGRHAPCRAPGAGQERGHDGRPRSAEVCKPDAPGGAVSRQRRRGDRQRREDRRDPLAGQPARLRQQRLRRRQPRG